MNITITQISTKSTSTNMTYKVLTVENHNGSTQWFSLQPWNYKKANLDSVLQQLTSCKVGDKLDIKFRTAKIGNFTTTLITSVEEVKQKEEEFVWLDAEQGGNDDVDNYKPTTSSVSTTNNNSFDGFDFNDFNDDDVCPF